MSKNLAAQAMGSTLGTSGGSILPANFEAPFKLFREAFIQAHPDDTFKAPDVMRWAGEYQRLLYSESKDAGALPSEFFNAYSMGRLLKAHQEILGIKFVGTYGNRAVYVIVQEETSNG